MLPQLSLFQQCPIQSQDVMQTWLHWRSQDAELVQKHFLALFHPKPNECLHFDLESCNLMCTYTVVTHPCDIPPLAQARPMMLCIYTSIYHEKSQLNRLVWGSLTLAPINELLKASKIGLKETPTLKLGQTPIMTVPQVCVFVNLLRETTVPP